jgi:Zn-dependent peptidase ImmA (M78 family)
MVTAYEIGEKAPGPETLVRIAEQLRFDQGFFEGDDLEVPSAEGTSFRAMSTMSARRRDQALGAGALAFALSSWIDDRFVLPKPDVPRYQGVDPETAAVAVRSEWGLGDRPIRNMIHTLEAQGVRVFSLPQECADVDAYSLWHDERPFVFLNTRKSAEHSRMDAAHELGHLVLHWKGAARGRGAEHEAAQFGSAFLMPSGSVLSRAPVAGTLRHLVTAKREWNVSVAALTYRMHDLGMLTDWQYRTLFKQISRRGYRTSEPNGIKPESSQMLAKVFQVLRDEGVSKFGIASELGISLDDLTESIFGLVLTSIESVAESSGEPERPSDRPNLYLV